MRISVALIALAAFGAACPAESLPVEYRDMHTPKTKWWKASLAVFAASTALDAGSSWGHSEANPLLRSADGRFGMQAIAIKGAVFGGVIAGQYLLLRNHPKQRKYGTITNFALSGVFTTAAITNFQRTARNP